MTTHTTPHPYEGLRLRTADDNDPTEPTASLHTHREGLTPDLWGWVVSYTEPNSGQRLEDPITLAELLEWLDPQDRDIALDEHRSAVASAASGGHYDDLPIHWELGEVEA